MSEIFSNFAKSNRKEVKMKTKELMKRLEQDGWYLHRHGANHDVYRHPSKSGQIIMPRHGAKEMPTGTANSILEKAGLK